jgi:hypothetical protein
MKVQGSNGQLRSRIRDGSRRGTALWDKNPKIDKYLIFMAHHFGIHLRTLGTGISWARTACDLGTLSKEVRLWGNDAVQSD